MERDDIENSLKVLSHIVDDDFIITVDEARKIIRIDGETIEALQAQLPKHGEWIEENRRPRSSQFVCSECHRTAYDPQPTRDKAWRKRCRYAYCPNCGAKMMEVQE